MTRNGAQPAISSHRQPPIEGRHREAFSQFLQAFTWNHFATLTAPTQCDHRLLCTFRKMIRRLERVAQGPVRASWVVERGICGTPHLHALLTGTERVPCSRVARAWDIGHCEIRVYDPDQGGAYYLTKTLGDEEAHWDISPKLGEFVKPEAPRGSRFAEEFDDIPCPFDF